MKEFTDAFEDIEEENAWEERVKARVAKGESREDAEAAEDDEGAPIPFMIGDRKLLAYRPTEGQLTFMLAALGRGQTNETRYAAIINIMLESLRSDDKDWLESRLLTRDRKRRIKLSKIEEVFEFLTEEWFRDDVPEGSPAQ